MRGRQSENVYAGNKRKTIVRHTHHLLRKYRRQRTVPVLKEKQKAYIKSTTDLQPYSTSSSGNPGNALKFRKGIIIPLLVCIDLPELIATSQTTSVRFLWIIQETIVIPPRQNQEQNFGDTSPEPRLLRISAFCPFPTSTVHQSPRSHLKQTVSPKSSA